MGLEDRINDLEEIAKRLGWLRPPRTSEERERYTQDILSTLKEGQEYGFVFELGIPHFQASSVKITDFENRDAWRKSLLALEKAHALTHGKEFFDVLNKYSITDYARIGSLVCTRMSKKQYLEAAGLEIVKASYADYPVKLEREK